MYTINQGIWALLISFIISSIICQVGIPFLKKLNFGQNVRDDGPKSHLTKSGTPTMGGIMIIIALVLGSLFFLKGNMDGLALLLVTLGFGLIGFIDDYIKNIKKRSLGLRAIEKIILQVIVTSLFLLYLINSDPNFSISYLPFGNGKYIDLGIFFIPFYYIVMIGTVNSVNLTDGLDGLASGVTVLVCVFFAFAALSSGNGTFPINCAAIGSLLGFLLFNSHPARVFMGDTGSLALGGFVAATSLILKMPLFILIVGLVYVIEALSVIIQVGYFKATKGKRFFKMAPFHHHLELSGFKETQVVTMLYIFTAIMCLIGYLGIPVF